MFYNCNEEIKRQSPTNISNQNMLVSTIYSRDRNRRQGQGQGQGQRPLHLTFVVVITILSVCSGWGFWPV
jgi:hypothetical protein